MLLLTTHRDGAARVTCGVRTQYTTGAGLAILRRKLDLDDLILAVINGRGPAHTRVPFRTGSLLGLPIEVKLGCCEAHLLLGLPFDIGACGANEIDAIVLLTAVQ